jgi:rRNA maturation endonuclease Nob1
MAERYEYKKVCKSCGNTFIAYTAFTKYCGEKCAKRDYRARQKEKARQAKGDEIKEQNRQSLLAQKYLSLSNAAALLGISHPTIYKIIATAN